MFFPQRILSCLVLLPRQFVKSARHKFLIEDALKLGASQFTKKKNITLQNTGLYSKQALNCHTHVHQKVLSDLSCILTATPAVVNKTYILCGNLADMKNSPLDGRLLHPLV